eukprot:TRINITY_DN6991_c0_g1_i1.p1 TRINITY_DN6991_c0_g1~~TRINITY_DN6991_c0_g1_i1.p1  ORF type:complete len:227 (-),score=53.86 TRINITY_DN6991_c0_g1_i1:109-789(-)
MKRNDLKVMFIGETMVGKSSLILRLVDDTHTHNMVPTIGIDFRHKTLNIDNDANPVHLQLWDTAGQERFRTITTAYYRGAEGFALVFDVTSQASFQRTQYWIETARKQTAASTRLPFILIANKTDLADKRVISTDEGREMARMHGMQYFEVSARTGSGVEEAFVHLARQVCTQRRQKEHQAPSRGGSGGSGENRPVVISSGDPQTVHKLQHKKRNAVDGPSGCCQS